MALLPRGAAPDSAGDIPTTRRFTHITPPSPSLCQTEGSGRFVVRTPTSVSSLLPSSPLSIHIFPRPENLLEHLFAHHRRNRLYKHEHFHFQVQRPKTRLAQHLAAQPDAIRAPHCAKHILRRRGRWISLRRIQPEHQLHYNQSHQPRSISWHMGPLGGQTRCRRTAVAGIAMISAEMVRDGKEEDVRTAVFSAILVGFAAPFGLKQTDDDLYSFCCV